MSEMRSKTYIVNGDGGSRGNPGPAAYGYVVIDSEGTVLTQEGSVIGEATNNVAEYMSAIEGLKALRSKIGKAAAKDASVEVRMDSELLVKQMNGEYRIKNEGIVPLFVSLWNARFDFRGVTFVHVPREENKDADRLVNEALDEDAARLDV